MSKELWERKAGEVSAQEYAAIQAEERLVYEAQKVVRGLLKDRGVKAADLATLLGVTEARVSQMLGGRAQNLTLRTIARIFHALGSRCVIARETGVASREVDSRQERLSRPDALQSEETHFAQESTPITRTSRGMSDLELWNRAVESLVEVELATREAFGKRAVWVVGSDIAPANENERLRQGEETARSWLDAPLHYESPHERRAYA